MMPARGGISLAALSALSAALGFAIWFALTWARIGTFEYPLDDVYIHLSMAEGITGGTYGINPGEPASAASSILYPLLLTPFPGTALQRLLPLAWNVGALLALSGIMGTWIGRWVADRRLGVFLALVLPFAANIAGVASLGMEHTLHALATVVMLLGFWRFLIKGEVGASLIAGVLLAPMLRFEGIGLALVVCEVVALRGSVRAAAMLAGLALAPAALFALFLTSQGLDPLPSSVLAKLSTASDGSDLLSRLLRNLFSVGAGPLLAGWALLTAGLFHRALKGDHDLRLFLLVAWLAATAHFLAGRIGWAARYEHYVVVMIALALVAVFGKAGRILRGLVISGALVAAAYYGLMNWQFYNWTARGVYLQHVQMARIAAEMPDAPVAVNDIGRVAWAQEARIVDLWGLAYADARRARQEAEDGPVPGWAGPLAEARGARYAMVYADWFKDGIGADWRLIAELETPAPIGILGSEKVSIFAIDPTMEDDLRAVIERLAPSMPEGTTLIEVN